MKIKFRQGIIDSQKIPSFLRLNGSGNVDFDASSKSTLLSFSEGNSDYLYTESVSISNAWNIPENQECWLYWDISKETGLRTFGYTLYNPYVSIIPTSPQIGQMYFDNVEFRWKEWNGQYWLNVIRIIAGYVDSNKNIQPNYTGTQVNNLQTSYPDYIVFDEKSRPIKFYNKTDFEFYTVSTIKNFKNTAQDTFSYERIIEAKGIASENITKHYCVTWSDYNKLEVADPSLNQAAFAIVETDVISGNIVNLHFSGFVTNRYDWNWTEAPNTILYVGNNGILTTSFDPTYSIQKAGYIVSPNTVYIEFDEKLSYYQI